MFPYWICVDRYQVEDGTCLWEDHGALRKTLTLAFPCWIGDTPFQVEDRMRGSALSRAGFGVPDAFRSPEDQGKTTIPAASKRNRRGRRLFTQTDIIDDYFTQQTF